MAKFDAIEPGATGQPTPDEVRRLLQNAIDTTVVAGETWTCTPPQASPRPTLGGLGGSYVATAQVATDPQLAVEALRALVAEEFVKVSRYNLVRQRAFSQRITELMAKYTNGQVVANTVGNHRCLGTPPLRPPSRFRYLT